MAYEVLHGRLAGLVYPFHELQYVMCIAVNNRNTQVIVVLVLNSAIETVSGLVMAMLAPTDCPHTE